MIMEGSPALIPELPRDVAVLIPELPRDVAALIPELPDDAALEIIIRIPTKALIRLSCLSKSWHLFIFSTPSSFARSNLVHNRAASRPAVVWLQNGWKSGDNCCEITSPAITPYLEKADPETVVRSSRFYYCINHCFPLQKVPSTLFDIPHICRSVARLVVITCCDGVFCLVNDCCVRCGSDAKIFLWNPTLHQCNLLPRDMGKGYTTLAVGFGFDSVSQDYIVAKVQYIETMEMYKISIYRLTSHSWTRIRYKLVDGSWPVNGYPRWNCVSQLVILKEYLYWIRENERVVEYIHITKGEDEYGSILIPDFVNLVRSIRLELLDGGVLSIHGYTPGHTMYTAGTSRYEHWLMPEAADKNNNAQWVKLFVMPKDLDFYVGDNSNIVTAGGNIVGFYRNYRELPHHILSNQLCTQAVVYDPRNSMVVSTRYKVIGYDIQFYVADNFVKSLVSVKPYSDRQWKEKKEKKKSICMRCIQPVILLSATIWLIFILFLCLPNYQGSN